MLSNTEKNKEMLLGSYKKLKSYYHYNKNFVFMKRKIAEFEYDDTNMEQVLLSLAGLLRDPDSMQSVKMIETWVNQIGYYVLPKSFVEYENSNPLFISSIQDDKNEVKRINFFIDMPIELHLLETLWTVLVGKLVFDKKLISQNSYGNSIDNYVLFNKQESFLDSINFMKNKLFKVYYPQYVSWKNQAIKTVEKMNKQQKSVILFSLDIKSFYYSVNWKFELLDDLLNDSDEYRSFSFLTKIIERIFEKYTLLLKKQRRLFQSAKKEESVLPIGLFSSMLLANLYMHRMDCKCSEASGIKYYGRYVDDIILVIDVTGDENSVTSESAVDKYLVEKYGILFREGEEKYRFNDYYNLYIQKDKVKIIFFEKNTSKVIINQLKKTIADVYPSQMNVIPNNELSLLDFEEAAYFQNGVGQETKIRDFGNIEVNRFQLGLHLSQIVKDNRVRNRFVTKEERIQRQNERDGIIRFFQGVNALKYSSNWVNAMYYIFLTCDSSKKEWKRFQGNIEEAIKNVVGDSIEDVKKDRIKANLKKMRKDLYLFFEICISTVLAINPSFSGKEKTVVKELSGKFRKANLFNHQLVACPLVNYADNLDENCDLSGIDPEQIHHMNLKISNSRKAFLSPRFIHLEEIYHYAFLNNYAQGGEIYKDDKNAKKVIESFENYFYKVNQIIMPSTRLMISMDVEEKDDYRIQHVTLGRDWGIKRRVRVAIGNIKLDTKRFYLGLSTGENIEIDHSELLRFIDKACNRNRKEKVDFLVFPEYYMPLQWIGDVLYYVRNTGITVIAGLQYMTCGSKAYNNVAVFAPVSTGRYRSAILMVREKNDYAPLERKAVALERYECQNQEKPVYQMIRNNGINYGLFLCYEFTDVIARGLYKNKVDMLFSPEYNRDTTYFSSILESTARDLHVFIVQANTSIYGDSRIIGPFERNYRNLVQIKGGDDDDLIIGTLEIGKVKEYQRREEKDLLKKLDDYLHFSDKDRFKAKQDLLKEYEIKIEKTSARFKNHS